MEDTKRQQTILAIKTYIMSSATAYYTLGFKSIYQENNLSFLLVEFFILSYIRKFHGISQGCLKMSVQSEDKLSIYFAYNRTKSSGNHSQHQLKYSNLHVWFTVRLYV